MRAVLTFVFISAVAMRHTDGCSCLPGSLQENICSQNTDFAILARVTSEQFLPKEPGVTLANDPGLNLHWRVYGINIYDVYKAPQGVITSASQTLFSNGNGALCGVSYNVNNIYVIVGTVDSEARLRVNLCLTNLPFSSITLHQWYSLITRTYLQNCQCVTPSLRCAYQDDIPRNCYNSHATCRRFGRRCYWWPRFGLRQCASSS